MEEREDDPGARGSKDPMPGSVVEDGLSQEKAAEMKESEGEEEGRDARKPRTAKKVSQTEKDQRDLTHTPFRSWCRYCVRGRARNNAHQAKTTEEKEEEREKWPGVQSTISS